MSSSPRVAYVLGNARTGSTIFGQLVGRHPEISHFGELKMVAERAWCRPEYCSCGALGDSCPFWTRVRQDMAAGIPGWQPARLYKMQRKYDRLRRSHRPVLDWLRRAEEFRAYGSAMEAMFDVLGDRTGTSVVLDTSKTPARGFSLLRSMDPQRISFLHLVRDPRAVTWSLSKSYDKDLKAGINRDRRPQSWRRTVATWLAVNMLSEAIGRGAGERYLRVRYEDFVREPGAVLKRVYDHLELPPGGMTDEESVEPFGESHVIAGNFVRMTGDVKLRPDFGWTDQMPGRLQKAVWRSSAWLARRYGYRSEPGAS